MLVFATKIPIKSDVTEQMFIDICAEWVYGSPHYHNIDIKYDISNHCDYEIVKDNIKCEITCYKEKESDTNIVAFRLHNYDREMLWIIELLYIRDNDKCFISVQNNCDSKRYDPHFPKSHKPNFIKLLMEKGYGFEDDFFPVSDTVIYCNQSNVDEYAAYINGIRKSFLPMVYISRDYDSYAVNCDQLAKWLSGMACVVVEENKETSILLRKLTNSRNAHNGFIGIYFPDTIKYQIYSCDDFPSGKFETNISLILQQSLINNMSTDEYNWTKIQLLKSKANLDKVILESKEELNEYVTFADKTVNELEEKISYLQRTNDVLTAQIETLKAKNKESTICIKTDITDFYIDEQRDFVLYLLREVAEKMHSLNTSKYRQHEILQSIIDNNEPTGENERIINELKRLIKPGMKWNSNTKHRIKSLGFQIVEGDHDKLVFKDNKYMYTISSTPSDNRGAKNLFSEIERGISISKKML